MVTQQKEDGSAQASAQASAQSLAQKVGAWANTAAPIALVVGALLTTASILLNFFVAPLVLGASVDQTAIIGGEAISNKLLLSQKIFYFHVPVAIASFGAIAFLAYYCIRTLATKDQDKRLAFDTRARIAAEVSLVFIIMTMLSGDLWTRYEWGVWWVWEPRLTTYLILMLLIIAYFILRTAIDAPERKATFAAVFGLIACVDAPISFMITRLVPSSIHPVIFRTDSGLSPMMLLPFLLGLFGMALIAFALYRLRLRQVELSQRLDVLKQQLEEEE